MTVIGLVGLLAAAAGCGGGPPSSSVPPATPGGPPAGALRVQVSGGEGEVKAVATMVAAFEAAHAGVDVTLVPVANQSEHLAKLTAAFAGQDPPDVFLLNYRRFGLFAERGVVAPPTGVDRAAYFTAPLEAFTVDGTLQCLPQNASSSVVYVNPALFARAEVALPPYDWTTAQALDTARALQRAGVEAWGAEPGTRLVAPFVWSAGGDVVDDEAAPTTTRYATDEGRRALQLLLDLQATGVDATERAAEAVEDRFARGDLAMFYDSRRAVPGLRKAGLTFDVRPLPRDVSSTSLLASDAYCVAKASKNLAAAHAFAAFAAGPVGGRVLAETGRTVPSLRALATDPAFLAPDRSPASAQVFVDQIDNLRRLPNVAVEDEAEEAVDEVLDQVFAGRMGVGDGASRADEAAARVYSQAR